jgi:ComF family protein
VLDRLLDAVFPKRCAGCGAGPWPFCRRCLGELVPLGRPWCERCGAPATSPRRSCRHCPPDPIAVARSAFLFDGPARRAVHRLKFSGWRPVAEALGAAMAEAWDGPAEVVTWVPLARRRRADRGFDQALALARVVGRRFDVPVRPLLRRVSDGGQQARRGGSERRLAVRGAFHARTGAPPRVLLVDDVLTTGATAAACAQALAGSGAREVSVLTAARAASGAVADLYSASGSRPGLWLPGDRIPVVEASRGRSDPRKPTLGR